MNSQERIPSRLIPGWEVGRYKTIYYKDQYIIMIHAHECTVHINDGPPFARYTTLLEAISSVDIRIRYLPELQVNHLTERVDKRVEVYHCSDCGYVAYEDCYHVDELGKRSCKRSTGGCKARNIGLRHVTNVGRILDEGALFNG